MSIVINVQQFPLTITPSNGEHVYTLSSSGYTLNNFKYICDIYFRPSSQNKLVSRLKVRPNSYGKAILDVGEIVRTLLKANPRASGTTYPYLNYVADENSIITLMDAQQTRDYNAFNVWTGGSPNANLDQLWHVEEYQLIVGCEYQSGATIVQDIDVNGSWQPPAINIFPGADNALIPEPDLLAATLGFGYNQSSNFFQIDNQSWYYYDLFRHVYNWSGSSTCYTYSADNEGIVAIGFNWVDCDGDFQTTQIDPGDSFIWCAQEGTVSIANVGQTQEAVQGEICTGYNPVNPCGPREFLNAGCRNYKTISQSGFVDKKVRRRQHHRECPIIISFLNGKNDYFTNDVYSIGVKSALAWDDPYIYSAEIANRNTSFIPVVNEQPNSLFRMANFYLPYNITSGNTLNAIPTNSDKLIFYGTHYNSTTDIRLNPASATTEILEFYIQPDDCINNPTHFLFLNERGMWDTYTFGKKQTKTIGVDRKKYRQETSLDKQFYARGSSQRGTVVYETDANYEIQCMSWYMDEGDTCIVEELFKSPEVYIITGTTINPDECVSCLDEISLYQHLIPVVIKDTTFEVYQKKYQKLYQYTFTCEYASIKRYRVQG